MRMHMLGLNQITCYFTMRESVKWTNKFITPIIHRDNESDRELISMRRANL